MCVLSIKLPIRKSLETYLMSLVISFSNYFFLKSSNLILILLYTLNFHFKKKIMNKGIPYLKIQLTILKVSI